MPIKLVVVDDEPETVNIFMQFLTLFGYEVIGALTGGEGIAAVHSHKPDALILDLMLPDADGYDICRDLRNAPDTKDMPIIIVSARTSQDEVEKGYKMGATAYLKKPVKLSGLLAEVQRAVDKAEVSADKAAEGKEARKPAASDARPKRPEADKAKAEKPRKVSAAKAEEGKPERKPAASDTRPKLPDAGKAKASEQGKDDAGKADGGETERKKPV
jgi:DNA-binding response OmpR family regulator